MKPPDGDFSAHWLKLADLFRGEFQASESAGERAFFARMIARCELRAKLNFEPRVKADGSK